MQAVLISIRPKWCELIASGEKTLEVRKTRPKIKTPFKCYIYETKGKTDMPTFVDEDGHVSYEVGGKVIGEFWCSDFIVFDCHSGKGLTWLGKTCLTYDELAQYLGNKKGCGWRISDLKIYDKPRELGEFTYWLGFISDFATDNQGNLKRPPQSWCYVESLQ